MGAWALSRKDRCIAQGLVPGATIHLEAVVNGATLRQATRIEEVGDDSLSTLVAVEFFEARPLGLGVDVAGRYIHRNLPWHFTSEVIGHSDDGMFDLLAIPDDARMAERRRFFRLSLVLPAGRAYRVLPATEHLDEQSASEFDATILELSEGGLQLSSRHRIRVGDLLGVETSLPGAGPVEARMTAIRVQRPSRNRVNYRAACSFSRIDIAHRQRIAQYLMSRQIEMRRKGQL
jgi:c-di-GMP-binding flagellar brake protein YcgR